jgi:hypothetical protein
MVHAGEYSEPLYAAGSDANLRVAPTIGELPRFA